MHFSLFWKRPVRGKSELYECFYSFTKLMLLPIFYSAQHPYSLHTGTSLHHCTAIYPYSLHTVIAQVGFTTSLQPTHWHFTPSLQPLCCWGTPSLTLHTGTALYAYSLHIGTALHAYSLHIGTSLYAYWYCLCILPLRPTVIAVWYKAINFSYFDFALFIS